MKARLVFPCPGDGHFFSPFLFFPKPPGAAFLPGTEHVAVTRLFFRRGIAAGWDANESPDGVLDTSTTRRPFFDRTSCEIPPLTAGDVSD